MCSVYRAFYLTVLISNYMVKASIIAVSDWKHCSFPDSLIVTLWGVSLGTCAKECDKKQACLQYNYRKRWTSCELLSDERQTTAADRGCVSGILPKETTQDEICSLSDEEPVCYRQECGPITVEHAVVYGNVWSEGSKVKVACEFGNNVTTATCKDNGEWKPLPSCPAACRPLTVANAMVHKNEWFKEDNVWFEGSTVLVSCLSDKTLTIATCHENEEWVPLPSCPAVDACPTYLQEMINVDNKVLLVCKSRTSQPDASEVCRLYGELVRIETMSQYYAIRDALQSNTFKGHDYWIQGKYDTNVEKWKFEDGTLMGLYYMITHNERGDMCVRLHEDRQVMEMHDRHCSMTFGYICTVKESLFIPV